MDKFTNEKDGPEVQPLPVAQRQRKHLPQGYRQGIITAITVLLGFTLGFFRFWGFESPGRWTLRSFIPATTLAVAVTLQIIALYRSLNVADDDEHEYRKNCEVVYRLGGGAFGGNDFCPDRILRCDFKRMTGCQNFSLRKQQPQYFSDQFANFRALR